MLISVLSCVCTVLLAWQTQYISYFVVMSGYCLISRYQLHPIEIDIMQLHVYIIVNLRFLIEFSLPIDILSGVFLCYDISLLF